MSILLIIALALLFVLGLKRSMDLASALRSPEQRQRLILRIAGFVAMSLWLHLLPSLLLTVYMRHEGILVPELLASTHPGTTVIGLYLASNIVTLVGLSCTGVLYAFLY